MATGTLEALPGKVGVATPRIDGPLKTSGMAQYAADFHFEGMVHAVPVCASIPSGKIRRLDTRATFFLFAFLTVSLLTLLPLLPLVALFADFRAVRVDFFALAFTFTFAFALRLAFLAMVDPCCAAFKPWHGGRGHRVHPRRHVRCEHPLSR